MLEQSKIASLTLINENSLQIIFHEIWYQEDVSQLTADVLSALKDHNILETISGADRENCRFEWQQEYFMMNFECYSQSCWIENETTPNLSLLTTIKQHLEVS
ncbi:DUF3630 family protein [Pseudocolwellia sp. HL-MZ19]|uniref:DUF3630 family protein n=1 Tax=unclassified Pseudocolwellia TaxID=2848178 RepID=UPI003CF14DD4